MMCAQNNARSEFLALYIWAVTCWERNVHREGRHVGGKPYFRESERGAPELPRHAEWSTRFKSISFHAMYPLSRQKPCPEQNLSMLPLYPHLPFTGSTTKAILSMCNASKAHKTDSIFAKRPPWRLSKKMNLNDERWLHARLEQPKKCPLHLSLGEGVGWRDVPQRTQKISYAFMGTSGENFHRSLPPPQSCSTMQHFL